MTECTQSSFEFQAHFSRQVVARFDGGTMTSDAGALLLRETDRRLNLLPRLAACFEDRRQPWLISHTVPEMVAQRVYGLALGYEDLNDHDQLREDPLLAVLSGKQRIGEEPLAGKSTLNRLELGGEEPSRYKKITTGRRRSTSCWSRCSWRRTREAPEQIVLDLDTTDLPLHGHQEGRFFHGYYDSYCYLPLYIFCGEHLLCARLRTADQDAAAGSKDEVERIVRQIRAAVARGADHRARRLGLLPRGVDELVRGARRGLCVRLRAQRAAAADDRAADAGSRAAACADRQAGAGVHRVLAIETTTGSWSRARRVVAKAEQLEGKENPRFVVTNLSAEDGRRSSCTKSCTANAARWRTASKSSCRCSPAG